MSESAMHIISPILILVAFLAILEVLKAVSPALEKAQSPLLNRLPSVFLGLVLIAGGFLYAQSLSVSAQFPERQIPVFVIAKPQKASFLPGEPILIDVEIKNGLNQEIRITAWSFAPNDWNGEVLGVELPDIYRIPKMSQIWLKRPTINVPVKLAAPGWYPIPASKSKTKTIDARKWEIVDGWIPGKYEMKLRVENIDVDSHTSMRVTSDPITIEVR
jgi:hypothetical protein